MKYQIGFTEAADDDIERLSLKMAQRISRLMDLIEAAPLAPPAEAMRGNLKGLYRMRAGDYRLVYSVDATTRVVTIIAIASRKHVYDVVERRLS